MINSRVNFGWSDGGIAALGGEAYKRLARSGLCAILLGQFILNDLRFILAKFYSCDCAFGFPI